LHEHRARSPNALMDEHHENLVSVARENHASAAHRGHGADPYTSTMAWRDICRQAEGSLESELLTKITNSRKTLNRILARERSHEDARQTVATNRMLVQVIISGGADDRKNDAQKHKSQPG
jgi:hypothetical protein